MHIHTQEVVGGGGGGGAGCAVVVEEDLVRTRAPSLKTQAPCEMLQSRLDRVAPRALVNLPVHYHGAALVANPALVSNSKLNSALLTIL